MAPCTRAQAARLLHYYAPATTGCLAGCAWQLGAATGAHAGMRPPGPHHRPPAAGGSHRCRAAPAPSRAPPAAPSVRTALMRSRRGGAPGERRQVLALTAAAAPLTGAIRPSTRLEHVVQRLLVELLRLDHMPDGLLKPGGGILVLQARLQRRQLGRCRCEGEGGGEAGRWMSLSSVGRPCKAAVCPNTVAVQQEQGGHNP